MAIGQDYYEPNQWGGPDVKVDVTNLIGLGTMAGFLTVANNTSRKDATDNRRVGIIHNFVAVYEKMVKRAMAILSKDFAPFSVALLPRYHKHPKMSPLHAAMIVSSYTLLPFQYPVMDSGVGVGVTGGGASTSTVEMERKQKIVDAILNEDPNISKYITTTLIVKNVHDKDVELNTLFTELPKASTTDARKTLLTALNTLLYNDLPPSQPRTLFTKSPDALAFVTFLLSPVSSSSSFPSGTSPPTHLDNLKKIYSSLSPDEITSNISLTALAISLDKEIEDARKAAAAAPQPTTTTSTSGTGTGYIRQLHYAPGVLTDSDPIRRAALDANSKLVPSAAGQAAFEYKYYNTTGGTLFSAGPLIYKQIPAAPVSRAQSETARYATGVPTRVYKNGKESRERLDYEKIAFRRGAFDTVKSDLATAGINNPPDLFVHAIAFPLSGSPASVGELTDIDRRVSETYAHLDACRGWAARLVLFSDITLQTDAAFAAANVPRPWFPLIMRKDETQHMRSIPLFNGLRAGTTYMEKAGMDRIASFTADNKEFRVEVGFGHKVMIEDNRSFYIAEYVKGDAIVGGCGNRFVNDGWWRGDEGAWSRNVAANIGMGERLGHQYTNIGALGTVVDAQCATGLYSLDTRGYHSFGDYCMVLPQNSISFAKRTAPMYPGQVVVTEAFPFVADTPVLSPPEFSFRQSSLLRRMNHTCDQVTQLVYCHTAPDKQRMIQSHHLWGDRLPGLTEKEQSNAPIKISDHFAGSTLRYLPQVTN